MGLSETEINLQKQVLELQQKLEAREEAFRNFKNVFQNAVDPILLISGDTFIDCNKAAVDILGGKKKKTYYQRTLQNYPLSIS